MNIYRIIVFIAMFCIPLYAQYYTVSGEVLNQENNESLVYATVRLAGSSIGTTTNKEGKFELRLKHGNYKIVSSFIGFISDTLDIEVKGNLKSITFKLRPSSINLSEVVILPQENPANEIIRRAIQRKDERNKSIQSYKFNAYTKGLVKTDLDLSGKSGGVFSLGLNKKDSSESDISGIFENQSEGYFLQPDRYKENILARKQTSNFPSSVNILTGGRIIQNFYSDDVRFFGRQLVGPLSSNSLKYYYFTIEDTVSIDNQNVFQLYMEPDDSSDAGFVGRVFISASNFDMLKVDFNLNSAANIGGIFDTIKIFQQFFPFGQNIFMPVDYHLYLHANILGLAKFGFEVNTALYDYEINVPINEEYFTKAIVTVLTDADKKDSTYWDMSQRIPNTQEELEAYRKIDSLQNVPQTFWDKFSFLSNRIELTNNFSVSAPLGFYHFNRVEGNSLDFGLFLNDALDYRLDATMKFNYGFADKKFKYDFYYRYLLGDYRTASIKLNVFNKTNVLFEDAADYSEFFNTLLCLISKDDINDYFYSKGFNLQFQTEVGSVLNLNAGIFHTVDRNAKVNSNFSIFAKNKQYRSNPSIDELKLNYFKVGFGFDFRNYIEDGMNRRRVGAISYTLFNANLILSSKSFKSDVDFNLIQFSINGKLSSFKETSVTYLVNGFFSNNPLPFQMMYSLPGNINLSSRNNTFRTLNVNEILGDKVLTVNLEYDMADYFLKYIKKDLRSSIFVNAAYSTINKNSFYSNITAMDMSKPFFEAGFSVGHALSPFKVEFAWKLNHFGKNNFRVGLSSLIID